ncbi:hypothetical protein RFI_06228 [Reticulomyxa filosa]|uniref:Uncharacterized protein n=1 Tax=Reticulomyxa filosa TaxID=46433 RepID=X6NY63_RETFI|nr:hypothetical protein RFI_06228 [Reticulomyxa filosa]|eukprot:ETO30891.1 hypothetical protein RFI_06228 [Reticulomyxa filosa]
MNIEISLFLCRSTKTKYYIPKFQVCALKKRQSLNYSLLTQNIVFIENILSGVYPSRPRIFFLCINTKRMNKKKYQHTHILGIPLQIKYLSFFFLTRKNNNKKQQANEEIKSSSAVQQFNNRLFFVPHYYPQKETTKKNNEGKQRGEKKKFAHIARYTIKLLKKFPKTNIDLFSLSLHL